MSGQDKQQDLLRELEIESILEETHYLADQEKMEQTAQKYRAKPKMDEIFSNADKKPRLKNKNPLDEVDKTNTIKEKKTVSGIPVSRGILSDWYIYSVSNKQPVWTEEHLDELFNDFYLIPKEKQI